MAKGGSLTYTERTVNDCNNTVKLNVKRCKLLFFCHESFLKICHVMVDHGLPMDFFSSILVQMMEGKFKVATETKTIGFEEWTKTSK